MLVAGIDPGGTTGYCLIQAPMQLIYYGEGEDRAKLLAWILLNRPDVIVVEDYRLYPGMGEATAWSNFPAVKVISALEELCEREGIELIKQSTSNKERITDKILKKAGLYKPSYPHANDAMRHALFFLWFRNGYIEDSEVKKILEEIAQEESIKAKNFLKESSIMKEVRKLSVMSALFFDDKKSPSDIKREEIAFISLVPKQEFYHIYNDCKNLDKSYLPVLKEWLSGTWQLCPECWEKYKTRSILKMSPWE